MSEMLARIEILIVAVTVRHVRQLMFESWWKSVPVSSDGLCETV